MTSFYQKRAKQTVSLFKRANRYESFLLLPFAILLWVYSLTHASVTAIGGYGLLTALPVTFFIAVAILSISFFLTLLKQGSKKLLFIHVILLVLFLFATPAVIEGARQRDAYSSYGITDYVVRTGFASTSVPYNNWPSFQIFTAIFEIISGMNPYFLVLLSSPLLVEILLIFPLYFLFNTTMIDNRQKWLAIWVFFEANWIARDYLSSQTFGFVIFVIIFTLLICAYVKSSKNNIFRTYRRTTLAATLILFFAVVTGHTLSSLIPLGVLFALTVTKSFNRKILFFGLIALVLLWTIYAANSFFQANGSTLLSQVTGFVTNLHNDIGGTATYHNIPSRALDNEEKIAYSAIYLLFAFSGLVISLMKKSLSRMDKIMLISLIGIWLLAVIPYGGELFIRLWLFSLPIFSYFIVKNVQSKKLFAVLIIFLILVAPTMLIWARNGEDQYDYIPPGEISGANFLYSNVSNGLFIGGFPWTSFLNSYDRYNLANFDFLKTRNNFTSTFDFTASQLVISGQKTPLYLIINHGEEVLYSRLYSEPLLFQNDTSNLDKSPLCNKIYTNPDFDIYVSLKG